MCGILGILSHNKLPFKDIFPKALNKISHRGPDAFGIYEDEYSILGHTRLSIIDLSQNGNQPMISQNHIIVFNGEIYNFKEIRDFLISKGIKFYSHTDTEVILEGYKYFGVDILNKLRGMFAFAIYDKVKKELFFARDRFGKKPFYYTFYKGAFIFSSEIKAIIDFFDKIPPPDKEAFVDYLRYLAPQVDKTMYENIKKLPASCYGILKGKALYVKRYYNILDYANKNLTDEKEILKGLEQLLIESIKLRLVSDVEVASLLSGGIDSSFVSAVYSKIRRQPIHTFSIGYDEHTEYSELHYAKMVAHHINSKHHEVVISSKDFINAIDEIVYYLDEPINDPATLPTYMISKEIKNSGIKVALSGEGSDELFFGYDMYYKYLAFEDIKNLKPTSKEFLKDYIDKKDDFTKDRELILRALKDQVIFRTFGECFNDSQLFKLLTFSFEDSIEHFKNLYAPYNHHISMWYYFVDVYMWIAEVLMMKIDKMSMANSVELRAPMLDNKLHEFVLNINPNIRISNTNKYLLKKIATKYLPKEIVNRRKKGFSYPFIEWFYKEKKDILESWLEINYQHNFFNEEFLKFLYEEGKYKRFKQHIWGIEMFNRWFKKTYL